MDLEVRLSGCLKVTHEFTFTPQLLSLIEGLECRVAQLEERMSSEQADVDALTASITSSVQAIQAEIANLEAQVASGAQPNLDALKAEVGTLAAIVPPAPPAPGTPAAPAA